MLNNAASLLPSASTLEKEHNVSLEKLKQSLMGKYKDLRIECVCTEGIPVEEINRFALTHEIDLMVIGSQGAGYLEARLFGNTATALMRDGSTAVLAVNKEMTFSVPRKILLAVDFETTNNNDALKPLKQFATAWDSHVTVLNVESDSSPADESAEYYHLAHALKHLPHSFAKERHKDVIAGINGFVNENQMDMVVMIARKHTMISRMLNEPHTKQMAFHSEVPLLVLHA